VNLGRYNWSDCAASLVVKWTGQKTTLGPPPITAKAVAPPSFNTQQGWNLPGRDYRQFVVGGGPEECEKACANEAPKCQAFTWVKPGVQGAQAVCWLKSSVPQPTSDPNCTSGYWDTRIQLQPPLPRGQGQAIFTPDISGKWQSSTGAIYKITQIGNQFSWGIKNGYELGSGRITGTELSASWSGGKGTGSATGKVIVDATGKATRIDWNNGVVQACHTRDTPRTC
jgi:hypothetical protein